MSAPRNCASLTGPVPGSCCSMQSANDSSAEGRGFSGIWSALICPRIVPVWKQPSLWVIVVEKSGVPPWPPFTRRRPPAATPGEGHGPDREVWDVGCYGWTLAERSQDSLGAQVDNALVAMMKGGFVRQGAPNRAGESDRDEASTMNPRRVADVGQQALAQGLRTWNG